MNTPSNIRLTVLMPTYNAGPYLADAIDSILNQTFTDFEFIVINDGSTDNTKEILSRYNDPRMRVINQQNKGLIDTLNEGITIATGDIIARMDSDDICFPNRLQVEYDFLTNHPDYVLVGAEADVIDKDGNFLMKLEPIGYSDEEIRSRIDKKCPFIHPSVMFRKKAVIDAGFYPKNALTFEDHLLWKKMLNYGKICNLRQILLHARFNPESVTIDEKWRGETFIQIRRKALQSGSVSDEDAKRLKELISSQNLSEYKQASYYAMVGKKYLWNNPNGKKARQHFAEAIRHYPKNMEPYLLYLFSFIPSFARVGLYKLLKK
ncbi:MAG: glycosyltransferase [Bacteroidetes bacterium]|nr:glycosyltransferase [Bacteroidota bacterium]